MKKILLTMCIAGSSFIGYSQFTAGNLVVLRANLDGGSGAPSTNLIQYSRSGGLATDSLNFPKTGAGRVVLVNGSGGSTFEGFLKLSADAGEVSFAGYDANKGTSSISGTSSAAIPRLMVRVNNAKGVTLHPTTTASAKYMRFALTAPGNIGYVGGNTQYFRTLDLTNTTSQAGTDVSNTTLTRVSAGIFFGKLYTTSGSNLSVFPDLPTDNSVDPTAIISGIPNNTTDFILFDTNSDDIPDLVYIGTDGTVDGNLYKYKFEDVSGTMTWVQKGSVGAPAELTLNDRKVQGITGYKRQDGKHAIFYSTYSSILSFVDSATVGDNINASPVVIASAPSGSIFRGLAFTPGSTTAVLLPIKLTSFTGRADGDRTRLSWSTASEINNSHFEILRSASGTPSESIGQVSGSGNSNTPKDYTFVDTNPIAGTNYYQLKQVDFDGKSSKSKVIAVKSGLKETIMTVSSGSVESISVNVYATVSGAGRVVVSDISGKKLADVNVSLQKGYNSIPVNVLGIKPGVYIVRLNIEGKNLTAKFVK